MSGTAAAVAVLLALTTAVLAGPPPAAELRRLAATPPSHERVRGSLFLLLALAFTLAGMLLGWGALGWLLAAAVASGTVGWLVVEHKRRRRSGVMRSQVAGAGGTLALLLRSGFLPEAALAEAAEDHPCLAPAATAVRLGGDVVAALRGGAGDRGAGGLRQIAAAWRVSQRTGAPLARLLSRVADALLEEQRLADVVSAELSAARTSGRLMACLPFVAIGLGIMVGADPLDLLFTEGLGELLFLAGVVLTAAGVVWTERIAVGASQPRAKGVPQ